jgi:hypothetical protein
VPRPLNNKRPAIKQGALFYVRRIFDRLELNVLCVRVAASFFKSHSGGY